jgi:hypothetical protein
MDESRERKSLKITRGFKDSRVQAGDKYKGKDSRVRGRKRIAHRAWSIALTTITDVTNKICAAVFPFSNL